MKKLKKKQLIKKSEELGWNVRVEGNDWEFEKFSPAGEDFIFSVVAETPKRVADEVRIYANSFDTEDHIAMWVEAKRSGRKGIPSIRQLVEDADAIDMMLDELADALCKASEEES